MMYKDGETMRAGTEAEDVGARFPSFVFLLFLQKRNIFRKIFVPLQPQNNKEERIWNK